MKTTRALAVACLLLTAGCSALPKPPMSADVYDFGPGAMTAAADQGARLSPVVLPEITTVGMPSDSTALQYRLAYDNAQQLRPYSQARWSRPPAQLMAQALREKLAQRRAVVSDNDNVTQQGNRLAQVRVELEEFSQVFTAPDASIGLVRLRASVTRDGVLGQRIFVAQRPAATQDAAGGARALAEAAAQAAEELAQWLQTVAP